MQSQSYTYLALGDSYTIGEMVPLTDSFPYQIVQLLRKEGFDFHAPEIIAKTGWTTDELQVAVNNYQFLKTYDFVSLLIGVNNQYRGRNTDKFAAEFEALLEQAIQFARNESSHVVVLSIPDWGVTPFAEGRDREKIAREIDIYNAVCREICLRFNIYYINITPGTREAPADISLLAVDGLHPSGKEYKRWAELVAAFFKSKL